MAARQLSVRSDHAVELAHRLAKQERRTVAAVVESALDRYAAQTQAQEPMADFFARMAASHAADDDTEVDLESLIRETRKPHKGIDL
jgi:hypothetical protein